MRIVFSTIQSLVTNSKTEINLSENFWQAVINILSEKVSEGKKYWEEFREIRENMRLPETSEEDGPYILANNFDEFKKIVELLRQDIKNVKPV